MAGPRIHGNHHLFSVGRAVKSALTVLYEDNHCLAVLKPARMLTVGDESDDVSLLEYARQYIKRKYNKPGDVFLGVVHRLDRPVSGAVLFARTSKAAGRLAEQFRQRTVRKVYHALVEGNVSAREGERTDWLLKNRDSNVVTSVSPETPGARKATLKFRRIARRGNCTLLEVEPLTGRSHQIRVQLAGMGHPICGDRKYGAKTRMGGSIALHAAELTFEHPTLREPVTVSAPDPESWERLGC